MRIREHPPGFGLLYGIRLSSAAAGLHDPGRNDAMETNPLIGRRGASTA